MPATETRYTLACRMCGQKGSLFLSSHGQRDWSFVTVGFVGLAVNRHNPPNSVLRCNLCWSPHVSVRLDQEPPGQPA